MKFLLMSLALLGVLLPLRGQEKPTPEWDVEIPVPISDGARAEPAPKPEPIDFKVLASRTQRMQVTEAPEMAGLPPIKGTIKITVQMVEDPGLPEPAIPLPALPPDDPAVIAWMKELRENYRGMGMVFVSASVYDHSRTLLRIYPNGKVEGEISAWTNIDFNHFSGFSKYRVNNEDGTFRDYGLLLGIGNTDTAKIREMLARHGRRYNGPEVPELPDLTTAGPSFVLITGGADRADSEAMNTLEQIHDLYRKEGVRMEEAFHAREKARAERYAYLLANPPVPEDVTIRFWKRPPSPKREDIEAGGAR